MLLRAKNNDKQTQTLTHLLSYCNDMTTEGSTVSKLQITAQLAADLTY